MQQKLDSSRLVCLTEPCMSESILYSMLISYKKKRNADIMLFKMVKEST